MSNQERKLERVTVLEKGFAWNGKSYASLSQIAKAMTGTAWNGHRFFGLRTGRPPALRKLAAGWRRDTHKRPPWASTIDRQMARSGPTDAPWRPWQRGPTQRLTKQRRRCQRAAV